ncbi:MAG: FKBP-type peptidyl-prolyl cis-trans isomerase [Proteobacteria bacterium]|nr:FKBP-type peptidyl-prolyl cis-trans isomerase [Pseudomonadota bacterium]
MRHVVTGPAPVAKRSMGGMSRFSGTIGVVMAGLVALGLGGCERPVESAPEAAKPAALTSDDQKASYSLGYTVRTNVDTSFPGMVDSEAFEAGITDAGAGNERKVNMEEAQRTIAALQTRVQQAQEADAMESSSQGSEFLTSNAQKQGVVVLDSGLQYEILVAGDGPNPGATDTVTTHYVGTLIDGTEFDSSVRRGEPASFPLNRVIAGWTEGLQLMGVGSKWRLFVPPELAYGDRPPPGIPANSTLIFEVELISID